MAYYYGGVSKKQAPSAGGYGYNYEGVRGMVGWRAANPLSQAYARSAQLLMQGSETADASLLQAYRDLYASRLGGAAAGQRQFVDQTAAEQAGQGLSPDLARRMIANRQAQMQQLMGEARGQSESQYGIGRAQLEQGVSGQLAQLMQSEANMAAQTRQQHRARKAANQAALIGLAGTVLGGLTGGIGMGMMAGSKTLNPQQSYAMGTQVGAATGGQPYLPTYTPYGWIT